MPVITSLRWTGFPIPQTCQVFKTWQVYLFIFFLGACAKTTVEEVDRDYGYDYFPLESGRSWTYEVDSIIFREAVGGVRIDTTRRQVREVVRDSIPDETGEIVYRIERYDRPSAEAPWVIRAVWTASRTRQQAFRTEDNLRFIKLVFPLREGVRWDGNTYLPEGLTFLVGSRQVDVFKGWEYRVRSVDQPAQVGDRQYEEVATIELADFESAIERRLAVEQYARGIGLVYREWIIQDTQCRYCCHGDIGIACQSLPWENRTENGLIVRQRLLDFQ